MTPPRRAGKGKAVAFVAPSGTGKTTLLEKLIAELKRRGRRVGALKHDAHRFDIDHPGKDSYRLAAAGADTTLITSPEKLALVRRQAASPPVEEIVAAYFPDVDIVLAEGFRRTSLPRIEVHRKARGGSFPRDVAGIADFLEATFIRRDR